MSLPVSVLSLTLSCDSDTSETETVQATSNIGPVDQKRPSVLNVMRVVDAAGNKK